MQEETLTPFFICASVISIFIFVLIFAVQIKYENVHEFCGEWVRQVNAGGYTGQKSLLDTCMEYNGFYADFWFNFIAQPSTDLKDRNSMTPPSELYT
jgi:hypothetical protein